MCIARVAAAVQALVPLGTPTSTRNIASRLSSWSRVDGSTGRRGRLYFGGRTQQRLFATIAYIHLLVPFEIIEEKPPLGYQVGVLKRFLEGQEYSSYEKHHHIIGL